MNLSDYRKLIITWAEDRNLIKGSTPNKQLDKLFEELGEFAGHSARGMKDAMKDDIGDMFVVLTILSAQLGFEDQEIPSTTEEDLKDLTNAVLYTFMGAVAAGCALKEYEEVDLQAIETAIFDTIYILQGTAVKLGFNFQECIAIAWDDIKDRKGRMVDGVFIKEADL